MQRDFETAFDTLLSILWLMPSSPLALLELSTSLIFSIFSLVVYLSKRIISNLSEWRLLGFGIIDCLHRSKIVVQTFSFVLIVEMPNIVPIRKC